MQKSEGEENIRDKGKFCSSHLCPTSINEFLTWKLFQRWRICMRADRNFFVIMQKLGTQGLSKIGRYVPSKIPSNMAV